jgi:hypothetical protein
MRPENNDLAALASDISVALKRSKELKLNTLSYLLSMAFMEAVGVLNGDPIDSDEKEIGKLL